MQRALNFRAIDLMTTGKFFQTHMLKAGPLERRVNSFLRTRPSDLVGAAAAQPDRRVQETRRRMIFLISHAHPVGIDSAKEHSADFESAIAGQHCGEKSTAFRASGKSSERNWPLRRLRPFVSNHLQRCGQDRQSPRDRIFARSNGRVSRQHNPPFFHRRVAIPRRIHDTGAIEIGCGGDNQNRPRSRGLKIVRKKQKRASGSRSRIATFSGVLLKVIAQWKLKSEHSAWRNRSPA